MLSALSLSEKYIDVKVLEELVSKDNRSVVVGDSCYRSSSTFRSPAIKYHVGISVWPRADGQRRFSYRGLN